MADTAENKDPSTLRQNSDAFTNNADRNMSVSTVGDAQIATAKEHSMTLWQGIRIYPKAIGWSLLLSTAVVMEGYDTVLIGTLYAFPAFQKKYGEEQPDGSYQITASWQAGLSNAMACGQIIGLQFTRQIAEKFGYRKTIFGALVAVIGFIFILFFAVDKVMLLVGEILMGLSLGVFQTITVTYASDVCPVVLRAYLTTYVNLCWVIGQLIGSGVLRALLGRTDQWSYRIPFAVQWVWPLPIMTGVIFAPESPWWLIRKERIDEARISVERLARRDDGDNGARADETIAMMIHTNEIEKQINEGTSIFDCFRGIDLRRTEIVCFTWAVQNLCGSGFMGYSTYFYKQAGLPTDDSFDMSVAQYGLGVLGTLFSWIMMAHFGRRTLYVWGLVMLTILLFVIGFTWFAGAGKPDHSAASWGAGSVLLVYTFVYDSTIGPVCYSLVSELPSTRLKNNTVVLGRNVYNIIGIVSNVLFPYMLNPTAWNWGVKAGFFWGSLCFCSLVWVYFRLPEPKGRTYAELDILFERKVSARKFAKEKINIDVPIAISRKSSDLSSTDDKEVEKNAHAETV